MIEVEDGQDVAGAVATMRTAGVPDVSVDRMREVGLPSMSSHERPEGPGPAEPAQRPGRRGHDQGRIA